MRFEQPIGSKNVFVATYSGNHGYNLLIENGWPNAYVQSSYTPGFVGLPTAAPDPRFNQVTELTNGGYSNYDAATLQFRRSFAYGFQGQISYTWSHALDTISNNGTGEPYSFCSGCSMTVLSTPSIRNNYASSDYDIRHNLLADFIWDMPWKPHNRLFYNVLGNWTLASKFFARTGTPFSVYDQLLAGALSPTINGTSATGGGVLLASALGSVNTNCGRGAVNTACFTSSQFVAPETETTFGNLGRNAFRGPGYFDIDTSLFKNINITEKLRFQFGATAGNLMNHPHFQNPVGNIATAGLGLINSTVEQPTSAYGSFQGSAVSGRVLVLSGRFQF